MSIGEILLFIKKDSRKLLSSTLPINTYVSIYVISAQKN